MVYTYSISRWLTTASGGRAREYTMVLGLATIQGFLWAMMIPVIPLLARSLGASEVYLGTISILPSVIAILFSIPGGALVTRYGKRLSFMASQVFGVVGGLMLLLTSNLGFLVIPQLLLGLSNMLFWPTDKAYLTELIPSHLRTRVVSYSMAISSGGSILGPAFGGFLVDHAGFRSVFVAYMVLSGLGCFLAMALPAPRASGDVSVLRTLIGGVSGVRMLLDRPMLRVTTLTTFFQYVTQGITEYFVPVYLKEVGYSATIIGTTVALRTAGMTFIRFFVAEIAAKVGDVNLLFLGLGICALTVGILPLFPVPQYVMTSFFIMGVAFGVAPVLTAALVAEHTSPVERSLGMALDSTSMYTGRVTSGLAIGAAAQTLGFGPAISLGNGVVMCGLLGVIYLYSHTRHRITASSYAAAPVDDSRK